MAYTGLTAVIPVGRQGFVVEDNPNRVPHDALIDADGITIEDGVIRKEGGASAIGDPITGAPRAYGNFAAPVQWTALCAAFSGSNFTRVQVINSGGLTTTPPFLGGTLELTVVETAVQSGSSIIVNAVIRGTSLSAANTVTLTVTDDDGNSYTLIETVYWSIPAGLQLGIMARATATTTLAAGQKIYVSILVQSPATVERVVGVATEYTGVTIFQTGRTADDWAAASTNANSGLTPPLMQLPSLIIGHITQLIPGGAGGSPVAFTPGDGVDFTLNATERLTEIVLHDIYRVDTDTPAIVGLHDWHSEAETAGSGTVSTTPGSTTVAGSGGGGGTAFGAEVVVGDALRIGTETRVVASITDDQTLDTTEGWITSNVNQAYMILAGHRILAAAADGNIYKEKNDDLDAVGLVSGLSKTARPGWFVDGGEEAGGASRHCFYFNGIDPVQVLDDDADTMGPIASPPADWAGVNQPVAGIVHQHRMGGWGNRNSPHTLYLSTTTDHEDFATTTPKVGRQLFLIYPGIGERLYGGAEHRGFLFLWKYPRGIFWLDSRDPDPDNWWLRKGSSVLGCAPTPYAVLDIDVDVIFLTPDAQFHALTEVSDEGAIHTSNLSRRLGISKWLRENINLARLDQVVSCWYPHKNRALWALPSTGSTTNDLLLTFDFADIDRGESAKVTFSSLYAPEAIALYREADEIARPMIGEAGRVLLTDRVARNKAGAAYTGRYQVPHTRFAHVEPTLAFRQKNYDFIIIEQVPGAAGATHTLKTYLDRTLAETLTIPADVRWVRRRITGSSHEFSFTLENGTLDEDMQILNHLVQFTPGDERV